MIGESDAASGYDPMDLCMPGAGIARLTYPDFGRAWRAAGDKELLANRSNAQFCAGGLKVVPCIPAPQINT
jgi:hypothetical protein